VLVPSTMELLGDRNWWLPRWLDRVLPRVDVEGGEPLPESGAPVDARSNGHGDGGAEDRETVSLT